MNPSDYFDSSALVKRYVTEIGSLWVRTRCADLSRTIATVNLSRIEAAAALAGKLRGKFIMQDDYDRARAALTADFQLGYVVISVTQPRINLAVDLTTRHCLRGYDALHLSCALLFNRQLLRQKLPPLAFIAADNDLLLAAQAEGLVTDNPNLYP